VVISQVHANKCNCSSLVYKKNFLKGVGGWGGEEGGGGGGASGGTRPTPCGRISTLLQSFKNAFKAEI